MSASHETIEAEGANKDEGERTASRYYLRTSDLIHLDKSLSASSHDELKEAGVVHHEDDEEKHDERWIPLDHDVDSPDHIRLVVDELVRYGLSLVEMDNVWTPDRKTNKLLHQSASVNDKDVWMWIGNVPHTGYGSDIPCVKSRGLVNMSPKHLAELLLDSSRVQSYNRSSQGRSDRWVWQLGVDEEGQFGMGETKVTRSVNKAPLIPRLLEFVCILHGRRLEGEKDGSYLVVARTVSGAMAHDINDNEHDKGKGHHHKKRPVRNEILLNVHLLQPVDGDQNVTDMTNINHLKSPLVPMMVAKKVGISSASSFFHDLRGLS